MNIRGKSKYVHKFETPILKLSSFVNLGGDARRERPVVGPVQHEYKSGWSTGYYAPITSELPVDPRHDSTNGWRMHAADCVETMVS